MSSEWLRSVLCLEYLKSIADYLSCARWLHDVVHVSALGSLERVCECVLVLSSFLFTILTSEDDLDGTLGSHDGDLGCRPGEVVITIEMLGAHHIIGTSVGLSCDEGNLRDCGLSVSVEKLGSVLDDATELLDGTWEEPWHISEGHDGNLEGIAESYEASTLD